MRRLKIMQILLLLISITTVESIEQVWISEHPADYFNGIYYRAEDWNGYPHFAKEDRSAHLYNQDDWYLFDNRENNDNEDDDDYDFGDWYNGGKRY